MREGIELLQFKTLKSINTDDKERLYFITDEGEKYVMYHSQDCCECVYLEDICGDLNDLIGDPILLAEEVTSNTNPDCINKDNKDDSFTWTFYKLATIRNSVTLRWYGSSNGYYSEGVTFEKEEA